MRPIRHLIRILSAVVVLGVVDVIAFPVLAARANLVNFAACNTSHLSHPFAPWGDLAPYELAPRGDFESGTWTSVGGAKLVAGSEPYAATGTLGSWSVVLSAGSSVQSPATCVDAGYPTIRFFIAGTGLLAVSVVAGGLVIPAGVAVAGGAWRPTPVIVIDVHSLVLAATSGGTAQISLRLTALIGAPQVDDVFVDPWNRG